MKRLLLCIVLALLLAPAAHASSVLRVLDAPDPGGPGSTITLPAFATASVAAANLGLFGAILYDSTRLTRVSQPETAAHPWMDGRRAHRGEDRIDRIGPNPST